MEGVAMAKAKRKISRGKSSTVNGATRGPFLSRVRVLLALAVVVLLGWGLHTVWQHVAPTVIHRDRYILTDSGITISPLPEWILGDVRAEVVHNAGLERRLSVLDDTFAQVVKDAFELHPWVESVDKITKSFPCPSSGFR